MRYLKALLAVWGIALVAIGLSHVVLGIDSVLGVDTSNATIDSEDRFAGALVVAYGLAYLWAIRQPAIPSTLLQFLSAITALGAVGRVVSMIEHGQPHWFYVLGTAAEFAYVGIGLWLAALVSPRPPSPSGRGHAEGE